MHPSRVECRRRAEHLHRQRAIYVYRYICVYICIERSRYTYSYTHPARVECRRRSEELRRKRAPRPAVERLVDSVRFVHSDGCGFRACGWWERKSQSVGVAPGCMNHLLGVRFTHRQFCRCRSGRALSLRARRGDAAGCGSAS